MTGRTARRACCSATALVQACDEPTGVLSFVLGSDGSGGPNLRINMGARETITPETIIRGDHLLRMNGREV